MTMVKIAVSLPREAVQTARKAVRAGRARSVSAYVAAAMEEKAKMDDLASMLAEMLEETGGPLTPDEKEFGMRALRGASQRKTKRARTA